MFKFCSNVDLGTLGCLIIRAGTQSDDAWLMDHISIKSETDPDGFSGVNSEGAWISSDTSLNGDQGELAMMWCRPPTALL